MIQLIWTLTKMMIFTPKIVRLPVCQMAFIESGVSIYEISWKINHQICCRKNPRKKTKLSKSFSRLFWNMRKNIEMNMPVRFSLIYCRIYILMMTWLCVWKIVRLKKERTCLFCGNNLRQRCINRSLHTQKAITDNLQD